ncbi:hypothetical protein [Capnocytophaga sp.]
MMRYLFLIFMFIETIHLQAQKEYTTARLDLKGKVKSVTEVGFLNYPPELANTKMIVVVPITYRFDLKGNLVEKNIRGDIVYCYEYDAHNHLKGGKRISYPDKGINYPDEAEKTAISFLYDKAGTYLVEKVGESESTTYRYFGTHTQISYTSYTVKGRTTIENDIYYKDNGQVDYTLQGDIKSIYHYDNKGQITDIEVYNLKGTKLLHYHYKYTYDDKGNWIEREEIFEKPVPKDRFPEIVRREITYYD